MQRQIESLQQELLFHKELLNRSIDWEVLRDKNGKLTYLSPSFEKITGYLAKDLLSGKFNEKDVTHPDDWELLMSTLKLGVK